MSDVFISGFRTQQTGEQAVASFLWDTGSLSWVPQTASTGTGGAVNVTNTYIPSQQYGTWSIGSTNTAANNPIAVRLTDGTSFYTATGGGSGGGNAAASATGSVIPASADFSGWNSGGNLVGTSLTTALPVQPGTGATFPVSGTFWQATQPVSGTFWQATQPVSIAASVAVTGAFYQATQPVSIAATVTTSDNHTTAAAPIAVRLTDGAAFYTAGGGGGGGANAAASLTGSAVPTSADYSGWNSGGTLVGTSLTTALPVQPGTGATFPVSGTFWQATQPVSVAASLSINGTYNSTPPVLTTGQSTTLQMDSDGSLFVNVRDALPVGANTIGAVNVNGTVPVSGTFWQATQPVSIATAPVLVAGSAVIGKVGIDQTTPGTTNGVVINDMRSTSLWVTVTAATGVAATATLPAAGAGLFHYITSIDIQLYATAARTGSATPVIVTTTNLPGAPAWNFPTAQAIGAVDRYDVSMTTPLKSSAANVATTIVAPIATTGIWRINVGYFTGT